MHNVVGPPIYGSDLADCLAWVFLIQTKTTLFFLSNYFVHTELVTILKMSQRGYYQNIENSTITAFAALSLLSAAGCMHLLKQWGKQLHNDWHKM